VAHSNSSIPSFLGILGVSRGTSLRTALFELTRWCITNHLDRAISRKKRNADTVPEGQAPISGAGQKGELANKLSAASGKPLEKIKRNPISKYKKAAGAKFGTVAAHNPTLFEKEAAKDGNN
jgi:hypothetical protein